MSAPTHPGTRATTTRVDTRLPWWALLLPAVSFLVLLMLVAGAGGAHATTDDPAVGRVLQQVRQTLPL
ncbi:hypothetical protein [Streptomyces sp. NPDC058872]|uniref:hypothetical protein n=1 Tax=Streptomyces sp. NPDC058872 TaxID=3346661 RepID=UPI0036951C4A